MLPDPDAIGGPEVSNFVDEFREEGSDIDWKPHSVRETNELRDFGGFELEAFLRDQPRY